MRRRRSGLPANASGYAAKPLPQAARPGAGSGATSLRRAQRGRAHRRSIRRSVAVLRPIDLAHARIQHGQHLGRARACAAGLGHRFQRHQRQHRQAGAEGQALGHAAGRAHARERAGTGAEGDGVAVGQAMPASRSSSCTIGSTDCEWVRTPDGFAGDRGSSGGVRAVRAIEQRAGRQLGRGFDGKDDRHTVF
jgi:hypothetical protein